MANAAQIKALLKSHIDGDHDWFYAVAMQMAADAARRGNGKVAVEIRKLIDEAKSRSSLEVPSAKTVGISQPRGELAGLLSVTYPDLRLSDMILPDTVHQRLSRILQEQKQASRLRDYGLNPRNKVLLTGPPGSGKTMTASVLASELKLPLFTILLDGLITRFMGETAAKLRLVFDAMQRTPGVYLFDEFDAIAGKREYSNDVGEIRRVLNSFLQFMEQDNAQSLIVAATNHPEMLDRAVFRRFDDVIAYDCPSAALAQNAFLAYLSLFNTQSVKWEQVLNAASGLSYADISRACEDTAKAVILKGEKKVSTDLLLAAIQERKNLLDTLK